jgi:hypothetical protein
LRPNTAEELAANLAMPLEKVRKLSIASIKLSPPALDRPTRAIGLASSSSNENKIPVGAPITAF